MSDESDLAGARLPAGVIRPLRPGEPVPEGWAILEGDFPEYHHVTPSGVRFRMTGAGWRLVPPEEYPR